MFTVNPSEVDTEVSKIGVSADALEIVIVLTTFVAAE